MIKFKELKETAGAGDWGTDEARKKLQQDTPGQGITDIGEKNRTRKESVDLDESQWGADNPYKKYKNDPDRLRRMLKKNQEAEGSMRNRIRGFMGSAPSGLKDELKDIERQISQIRDVMREEVELEEKLKVSDGLGAWIKDFQDSDAPQFKDADSKKRRDMAIAAFTAAGGKLDEASFKVHVDDGRDYGDDPHTDDIKHMKNALKKHRGEVQGHTDKGFHVSFKNMRDAEQFKHTINRGSPKKSFYAEEAQDLQERPFGGDSVLKDMLPGIMRFLDRTVNAKRYQFAVRTFLDLRKKNPGKARENLVKTAKIVDVDVRTLDRLFRDMVKKGVMPKHLIDYHPTFVESKSFREFKEEIEEGSETWEAGYDRRVVKTTNPEHKEKGYNWRIKGKDRPEISIKLYKDKPSFKEFTKQMKRVAGHEFGG